MNNKKNDTYLQLGCLGNETTIYGQQFLSIKKHLFVLHDLNLTVVEKRITCLFRLCFACCEHEIKKDFLRI